MVTTPLATPVGLTATLKGATTTQLSWSNKDAATAGYEVLRSTNGNSYIQVGEISSPKTTSFVDSTLSSGGTYSYEVLAINAIAASAASAPAVAITPLAAPTGLTTAMQGATVTLGWTDNDPNAAGYSIFRSVNGQAYTDISDITGGNTVAFTDASEACGHTYSYEVRAFSGSSQSPFSTPARITTLPAAPDSLSTTARGSIVNLNWTGNDPNAAGTSCCDPPTARTSPRSRSSTASPIRATATPAPLRAPHTPTRSKPSPAALSPPHLPRSPRMPLAAPGNCNATLSGTTINLTWTGNDPTASGYTIMRSTDGVNFTQLTQIAGAAANAYSDTAITPGQTYSYQVIAFTDSAVSAPANSTVAVPPPPATPTALAATGVGTSSVKLAWIDNDNNATGYFVLRSTDGTNFTTIAQLDGVQAASFTDLNVGPGTTYSYEVQAYNGGILSTLSAPAAVRLLVAPTNPTAMLNGTAINVTWTGNDPSANGYTILRSTDGLNFTQLAQVNGAATGTFNDTTVTPGNTYHYQIIAFTSDSTSDAATSTATVPAPPATPSALKANGIGASTISLGWTENDPTATGYFVLRSTDGTTFTPIAQLNGANATSYTDSGVEPGTNFTYEVEAFDGGILSTTSAPATARPLAAPSNATTTLNGTTISLTWTGNDPAASGYTILRSTDGVNFAPLAQVNSASTTSYTDSAIATGKTYWYQVIASTASSASAAASTSAIVPATPAAPSGLTATGAASPRCTSMSEYPPAYSTQRPSPSDAIVLVTTRSRKSRSWLTSSTVP